MLELMHVQVLGLYFNSRINSISEPKYFDFHTHVRFKWGPSGSAPTTGPVWGENRRHAARLTLTCLSSSLPADPLWKKQTEREGVEVRMGRRGMIQQGNRPWIIVGPLALQNDRKRDCSHDRAGAISPEKRVTSVRISHILTHHAAEVLDSVPHVAFVSCLRDCSKVWNHRNKHRFAYSGENKSTIPDNS